MNYRWKFLLLLWPLLSGCSTIRESALSTATPLFYKAGEKLRTESNWHQFVKGTPANLTLLEGMLAILPSDGDLLATLTKGYSGYAFGAAETFYLRDRLGGKADSPAKRQAIARHSRAFEYGLRYLKREEITLSDLQKANRRSGGIPKFLDEKLGERPDKRNLETIFFVATSLGGMINLQREEMLLVGNLPIAVGMFDWACGKNPSMHFGACTIFYGGYYAGRPAMLGGDPAKGRRIFEEYIAKHPDNWIVRVAYIEHYIIPFHKESLYRVQKAALEKARKEYDNALKWHPLNKLPAGMTTPENRLYQAIAIRRFKIILNNEKHIFSKKGD